MPVIARLLLAFRNAGIDYFGPKLIGHDFCRGSLIWGACIVHGTVYNMSRQQVPSILKNNLIGRRIVSTMPGRQNAAIRTYY